MPRIRCYYLDCILLDDGYCSAAAVELDPDEGCLTYARSTDAEETEEEWDDETELEEWEDDLDFEDDDDEELWVDDEDEEDF